MSVIGRHVTLRLAGSVGLTLTILAGIAALFETLNTRRLMALADTGGPLLALAAIATSSAQWLLEVLPQGVLIGLIVGLVGLQQSREMLVMKGAGLSIWQLMRGPVQALLVFGLVIGLGADAVVVSLNRTLSPGNTLSADSRSQSIWIEETGAVPYVLSAGFAHASGDRLDDVKVFLPGQPGTPRQRLEAPSARLVDGSWHFDTALRLQANEPAATLTDYRLPTTQSAADMRARLASVQDRTWYELLAELRDGLSDPVQLAATITRLVELFALPASLIGSATIAFAFTAGYRRDNKYAATVLYGVVLGFVVYVASELAVRAGAAGVIDPLVAVLGPPALAAVIGVTVLLHREDGRT
jgi:lipopolysaccharide export system permease protein